MDMGIIALDQQRKTRAGLVERLQPPGFTLVIARTIGEISTPAYHLTRCADRQVIADRHIDRPFGAKQSVTSTFYGQIASQYTDLGLLSDHVDRARRGIASIKRTLGALEHFDTLDIKEIAPNHGRIGQKHAIEIEGHGQSEKAEIANVPTPRK